MLSLLKRNNYIIISKNKKAKFNYNIIYKIESGIILSGNEVKSIKSGHIDLSNSYGLIKKNEIFLHELKTHVSSNMQNNGPSLQRT